MIIKNKFNGYSRDGSRTYNMGGGGGQPSSTSQTTTTIPDYAKPYVEKMLGKSEALTSAPYQPYSGERIAGFSPMQQQAQQSMGNLQTSRQLGVGTQMAGMAGLGSLGAGQQYAAQATNPYATQAYMSPYMQNVVDVQQREAARQSGMAGQQEAAQAVKAGAFGGGRHGIVEAERQRNLMTQMGDIQARGSQAAFDQAQKAQQFGAQLGLQGLGQAGQIAGTLGQLGQTEFGQQKDIIQGQLTAGQQQQELEQKRLSQEYSDFAAQRQQPYQQLAFMSDMLRGLPLSQTAQQMYQQPESPLATAAGLGLSYMGAKKAGYFADGGLTGLALYNMSKE